MEIQSKVRYINKLKTILSAKKKKTRTFKQFEIRDQTTNDKATLEILNQIERKKITKSNRANLQEV